MGQFLPGHNFGNHNNHKNCGRLSEDQYAELKGLVPKAIDVWRAILNDTSSRWTSVRADVAGKILNKFVPELIEGKVEHEAGSKIAEFLRDTADRIAGKASKNDTGAGDSGSTGSDKGTS